jgi:hypothetical protein
VANKEFIDGISSLDAGTNSGVEHHLLQSNQTSWQTNATNRGAFIGPRPGVRRISLSFSSPSVQSAFTTNNWQGGTFYTADDRTASMLVQIGGRVFQITPDPQHIPTATVVEHVIPGGANPATQPQAWLWQTENYVVGQDGLSIPWFFDGTSIRRSNSVQVSYGVTAAAFTAPAIGELVAGGITLAAPYTGPPNAVVLIGDVLYQITSGALGYAATLTTLYLAAPVVYPNGTQVVINPNVFAVQSLTAPIPGAGNTYGPGGVVFVTNLTAPYTGPTGVFVTLFGVKWMVTNTGGVFISLLNQETVTLPATINAGDQILNWNTNLPNSVVGGIFGTYVAPAVGASSTVLLDALYSGSAGQMVFINGDQFLIAPIVPPPPGIVVQAINLTDTPGTLHAFPPGLNLLSIPELPPGRMGDYGPGQNAMSLTDGVSFIYSDLVGSSSGTQANNYRDAVLRTIQTSSVGGLGNFRVPSSAGEIRAMKFVAMPDVSLGQGPLAIFTPRSVFNCKAPLSVTDLATLTSPILTEALKGSGGAGQYDVALNNVDIFFGSSDNAVRSYLISRLDYNKWPNTPISREVTRGLKENDKTLLQFGTSVVFDNRLLKSVLPASSPLGIFHRGLVSLNLDPLSTMRGKLPSIWEGIWTGLNIFQLLQGFVNGADRCYAFVLNRDTLTIEFWELLADEESNFDLTSQPITWSMESAALFQNVPNKGKFELCELQDGEIYVRDIRGIVTFETWYRPDYSECWTPWHKFTICAANDALTEPKQFRTRLGLGTPDVTACEPTNDRPYRVGNDFQFRLQITGACKFMGAQFKAHPKEETYFSVPICDPLCDTVVVEPCEPCKIQAPCLTFPLVFYSFGKSYTNPLLRFDVTCPDGSVLEIFIQPGTINYTLPYPPDFGGVYPPLVLGCVNGNIVREVPTGATQEQIDVIVNEMIAVCALATANASALCPQQVTNNPVYFDFPCETGEITLTGVVPAWISVDVPNSRLVGASGVFTAATQAGADALAQAALNNFAGAAVISGDLSCEDVPSICTEGLGSLLDNVYQITAYVDGLFANPTGGAPGVDPVWTGTLVQSFTGPSDGWISGGISEFQMDGLSFCTARLFFDGCTDDVPQWTFIITADNDATIWTGVKVGGNTPEGVYPRTGGIDATPASINIELGAGATTPGSNTTCLS